MKLTVIRHLRRCLRAVTYAFFFSVINSHSNSYCPVPSFTMRLFFVWMIGVWSGLSGQSPSPSAELKNFVFFRFKYRDVRVTRNSGLCILLWPDERSWPDCPWLSVQDRRTEAMCKYWQVMRCSQSAGRCVSVSDCGTQSPPAALQICSSRLYTLQLTSYRGGGGPLPVDSCHTCSPRYCCRLKLLCLSLSLCLTVCLCVLLLTDRFHVPVTTRLCVTKGSSSRYTTNSNVF